MAHQDRDRGLVRWITHPWLLVTAGVTAVTGGMGLLNPLVGFIVNTSGAWFPLLGVFSTLGSQLAIIPMSLAQPLFVAGAVVFAVIQAYRLYKRADKRFNI